MRLETPQRSREVGLFVPSGGRYRGSPVILVFHGLAQSVKSMQRLTGLDGLAQEKGVVVAYPVGYWRSWNDGDDTKPATRAGIDDLGFVESLLDYLVFERGVDRTRIFAVGFSNGGFFLLRNHCRLADRIAAAGIVAAGVHTEVDTFCEGRRSFPVTFALGDEDPLVPWDGWPGGGGLIPSRSGQVWARLNRCRSTPDEVPEPTDASEGSGSSVTTYSDCLDGATVRFHEVSGGGHTWPGGDQYLPAFLVGRTSRDLDLTRDLWGFFAEHPLQGRSPTLAEEILREIAKAPDESRSGEALAAFLSRRLDIEAARRREGGDLLEWELNRVGYLLLRDGSSDLAVEVLAAVADRFPGSWNAQDSLGEALLEADRPEEALESYRRSICLNPENANAAGIVRRLQAKLGLAEAPGRPCDADSGGSRERSSSRDSSGVDP